MSQVIRKLLFSAIICAIVSGQTTISAFQVKSPTVMIATLIRNKADTLPYFFTYLEELNYPKDRISLWICSDHNEDNSIQIIDTWLNRTKELYHSVDYKIQLHPKLRNDEDSFTHWSEQRFADVITLKEAALKQAKQMWADYVFFLDADVFLTNPNTLRHLVALDLPIVTPMLKSEAWYSNFWCGMSEYYYYVRTEEYKEILGFEKTGQFSVPMVHSAVLINVNLADYEKLTFNKATLNKRVGNSYNGPNDDIITFAISANQSGISMYVTNVKPFGFVPVPLDKDESYEHELKRLSNILILIVDERGELRVHESLRKFVPNVKRDKIVFDEIFLINLERRPERRKKMEKNFEVLGLDVRYFPAFDGKQLTDEKVESLGIKFLPGYLDPYHKRPMTFGEIGCFLSHYYIWETIVKEQLQTVLIIEDDVKFEPYFRDSVESVFRQIQDARRPWNLIYVGRKRLQDSHEPLVPKTTNLFEVDYSYWTLGYMINLEGAKKLLAAKPLEKLLPVDEFLPIMFDKHPNEAHKNQFANRNLIAWTTSPLLMYPTHYTGEDGYISDTEASEIIATKDGDTDESSDSGAEKKGKKGSFEDVGSSVETDLPDPVMSTVVQNVELKRSEL